MFASRRISTPIVGKREVALTRMRTAAGIISRCGASSVDITQVLGGYGAGTFHLYAYFESMEHSMDVSHKVRQDKAYVKLEEERELTPSAQIVGPELGRTVAGEINPNNTAAMVREYIMPRENLSKAAAMVPSVQEMLKDHGVNVSLWVPVIAEDMKRVSVVYGAPDTKTLGKATDEVGITDEFQEMLVEAAKLGTLDRAFGMVQIN